MPDTHLLFTSVYKFHARSFDLILPELALEICISIWQDLLGGKYSELFEDSAPIAGKDIGTRDAKAVRRIYNLLKAASFAAKTSYLRSFGGKLVFEGKLEEKDDREVTRKALTAYEFLAVIDELRTIAECFGKSRIVVVADEFNYWQESEQQMFVQDFFEVLSSRRIQFALIGVALNPDIVPGFRQCVETIVKLGPFQNFACTKALLLEGLKSCPSLEFFDIACITDENIKCIHNRAEGNPRRIQELCYHLFDEIIRERLPRIGSDRIEQVAAVMERERNECAARIRAESDDT